MNAMILGGSWNIIGWIILAIVAVIIGCLALAIGGAAYIVLAEAVSWRWHRFWCRRGRHLRQESKPFKREQVEYIDAETQDLVHREYAYLNKRCLTCGTTVSQEKKLESENRITRLDQILSGRPLVFGR